MKLIKVLSLLLLLCAVAGCKKDSNKGGNNSPSSEYYFIGSIGGKSVNWEATTNGNGWAAGSSANLSNNEGNISGGITALLTDFPAQLPQLGIEFKTFNKGANDNATTVFNSFIKAGSWTYASTLDYTVGTKSIVVYYTDSNGNQYSSIGAQSGSAANVLSVTQMSGDNYNAGTGLKIKMTFNCTLYPVNGSGSPISITNGQATVFLEELLDY